MANEQDGMPWWAKLSASSALIIIALGGVYTLREDVLARQDEMVREHTQIVKDTGITLQAIAALERNIADHIESSNKFQRSLCLNQTMTIPVAYRWIAMQNCEDPSKAVWPQEIGKVEKVGNNPTFYLGKSVD